MVVINAARGSLFKFRPYCSSRKEIILEIPSGLVYL